MASLFVSDTLPTSSEEAIRKFDEKYLALLSAAEPSGWAARFLATVDAPRVTYPLAIMNTMFNETKEESGRFKGMSEKTFDLKVAEYDAGYEAKMFDLLTSVFAWKRWSEVPREFVLGEERHHASKLVAALEAGTSALSPYDDVAFFATTHLCDPTDADSTQWSNYVSSTTAPSLANIQIQMIAMQSGVLDVNGNKLQANPTEIWLPTEKFQSVSDALNQAFLSTGESNMMTGKLTPVHVPELTDPDDWYLVDTNLISRGYDPMVANKFTALDGKLGLRYLDESSDHFKKTGKISVSKHIWSGYSLLFPHAIRLIKGA